MAKRMHDFQVINYGFQKLPANDTRLDNPNFTDFIYGVGDSCEQACFSAINEFEKLGIKVPSKLTKMFSTAPKDIASEDAPYVTYNMAVLYKIDNTKEEKEIEKQRNILIDEKNARMTMELEENFMV